MVHTHTHTHTHSHARAHPTRLLVAWHQAARARAAASFTVVRAGVAARVFSAAPSGDSDADSLRALLARERAARAAAEAARAAAEAARAAAEAARAVAEARAADDRTARAASEKREFFSRMMAISSSSSIDSRSNADVKRRHAPAPATVPLDALFAEFPLTSGAAARAAWGAFRTLHAREWRVPPNSSQLREPDLVHLSVFCALRAAAPQGLRVWREELAADDEPRAEIKPDFSLTDARDATQSSAPSCSSRPNFRAQ